MEQAQEQFDGEMLIIADRDIAPMTPLLTTVVDTKSGQKGIYGPTVLEMLALIEEAKTLRKLEDPTIEEQKLAVKKVIQANACLDILRQERQIRKELLETLMEGKMKVGLWIDSIGGDVRQEDKVNWALDYLDGQGAAVNSYVGIKAVSAAFDMAFLGDKLSALDKSVFMWHFSETRDYSRAEKTRELRGLSPMSEETQEEFADLLEILDKTTPENKERAIAEILRQINDPRNSHGAVYLDGYFLNQLGLAHQTFERMEDLVAELRTDFPAHKDLLVTQFTTAVAEKVFRQIEQLPSWRSPAPISLTEKIQGKYERGTRPRV